MVCPVLMTMVWSSVTATRVQGLVAETARVCVPTLRLRMESVNWW